MDTPKVRKIVSSMFLDIITGDVHTRNQFMSTLIPYIMVMMRKEKLEPRQPAIEKFRTRLHNTVFMILQNNHPLPAYDTKRPAEIQSLLNYFDRFAIRIDNSVADPGGLDQMQVIEDIETLEYCRNVCYTASGDYSDAMAGNKEGLTQASNKFAYILNYLIPIVDRYNMVDISDSDYSKAAGISMVRMEKAREASK